MRENFDDRVKIVNLNERKGLIVTRMEGARRATGEVLVFLDSHMEANVNWLPPLLGETFERAFRKAFMFLPEPGPDH